MGKTPRLNHLKKKTKSVQLAERWLRLLIEHPILPGDSHEPYAWCNTCETLIGKPVKCPWCGRPTLVLDNAYWGRVSDSVRRAVRRDPEVIARVKAESRMYPVPMLPEPLSWITDAWVRAGKPSGRPREIEQAYGIDFFVRELTHRLGLSRAEALDVLSNTVNTGRKRYADLSEDELNAWEERVRYYLGNSRDPRELRRILSWVRRQRNDPRARLKGERVRASKARD